MLACVLKNIYERDTSHWMLYETMKHSGDVILMLLWSIIMFDIGFLVLSETFVCDYFLKDMVPPLSHLSPT